MKIHEITEGRFDPYQNKAIFFAGVPGAGKTFIARRLSSVFYGLKQVNPDAAFKHLLRKKNLSLKMPPQEEQPREIERQRSKQITGKQQELYQQGNLGMLIDTTGRAYDRVSNTKEELEAQGYDTMMVYVDADIETAVKRNSARERSIPEKVLLQNFGAVKQNLPRFQELFGDQLFMIDNSIEKQDTLSDSLSELEQSIKIFLNNNDARADEYFSEPRTVGIPGYGSAHPDATAKQSSLSDKFKALFNKKKETPKKNSLA